jgi:hypothetical protein
VCEQNYITEFRENGDYVVFYCEAQFNPSNTGAVRSGTYTINTANGTLNGFDGTDTGTYTLNGNRLSMVLTFE